MSKRKWDYRRIWKPIDRLAHNSEFGLSFMGDQIEMLKKLNEGKPVGRAVLMEISSAFSVWDQIEGTSKIGRGDANGWQHIECCYQYQRLEFFHRLLAGLDTGGGLLLAPKFVGFLFHSIFKKDEAVAEALITSLQSQSNDRSNIIHNPYDHASGCFALWLITRNRRDGFDIQSLVDYWMLEVYSEVIAHWGNLHAHPQILLDCCEYHCQRYSVPEVPEWDVLPYTLIPIEIAVIEELHRREQLPWVRPMHWLLDTPFARFENLTIPQPPSELLVQTQTQFDRLRASGNKS